jgi:hypothetical protein
VKHKEQRSYPRFEYRTPISFGYSNLEMISNGITRNYSMGGLCFESNFILPKGTEIHITMMHHSSNGKGPESRKRYQAEVRWCRKIDAVKYRYQSGINFFEPVLY